MAKTVEGKAEVVNTLSLSVAEYDLWEVWTGGEGTWGV